MEGRERKDGLGANQLPVSIYSQLAELGSQYFKRSTLFRYGFNWSPMYRRSTGRIISVSEDLLTIRVIVPISYKNRNYVNSIFGGSMFASVDPIPMVQLINLLGDDFVVWDRSAEIVFKRPAREDLYAEFLCSEQELEEIKARVAQETEINIVKTTLLTDRSGSTVFCQVDKTLYITTKEHYRDKQKRRRQSST